jgi:uncharacterized protein (TIGR03437 family)
VREFASHNAVSSRAGANGTHTHEVEWTPPATASGDVIFYAAGNASNNAAGNTGDRIYTTSLRISPAPPLGRPTVSQNAVVRAFSQQSGVSSGAWLEIYGTNLALTTREWAARDFDGVNAPTNLDGVSVYINGQAAYVRYVSPTQINVQAASDDAVGPVAFEVVNQGGRSAPITLTKERYSPAVYAPFARTAGGQFVGALLPNSTTYVGSPGVRGVRPGETIVLFGIGFGPTNPAIPAGQIVRQVNSLATPPVIRFGETAATATFAGLVGDFIGLYQFNVTVPNVGNGDVPITIEVGGTRAQTNLFLTVQQ